MKMHRKLLPAGSRMKAGTSRQAQAGVWVQAGKSKQGGASRQVQAGECKQTKKMHERKCMKLHEN